MSTGFKDPEGNFPRSEYEQQVTTNKAARGEWEQKIVYPPVPENTRLPRQDWEPEYPHNKVEESKSGHRMEVDDTPGKERLTWVHEAGHGIEMYPEDGEDGMLINTIGRMVKLVGKDFLMVVNGDGNITYTGNLNLNVTGDFNIKCNNFTLETQGRQVEEIKQEKVENFVGDRVVTTQGSKSEVVLGSYTVESMDTTHIVSKKDLKISAPGDIEVIAGGELRETAEERITTSAPENFMLGNCTTVAGGKGTIGGENHVFYAKSTHSETVDATTVRADGFIGNLKGNVNGNADTATKALTASMGSAGGGGSAPTTNQSASTTAKPTHSNMDEALNQTKTLGVRRVEVDDGRISQSVKGGGGSSGEPTSPSEDNLSETFEEGGPVGGPVPEGEYTDTLAAQRAQFAAELEANPALKEKVQALANAEMSGNPGAIMETMMNRAAAEGKTLSQIVNDTNYWAPYKDGSLSKNLSALRSSPTLQSNLDQALQNTLAGSNVTKLATHAGSSGLSYNYDASGNPAYGWLGPYLASGTQTTRIKDSNGLYEYFYRKDKAYTGVGKNHGTGEADRNWYNGIVNGVQ